MPDKTVTSDLFETINVAINRALADSLKQIADMEKDGIFSELPPLGPIAPPENMLIPVPMRTGPTVEEIQPVVQGPEIDKSFLVDVDSTENRKRKILEWELNNVSQLKSVPKSKERAIRLSIAEGINKGWSRREGTKILMERHGLTGHTAKLAWVNELRRGYRWAFRKTGYENGFRYQKFRVHPTACPICMAMNGQVYPIEWDLIPDKTHPFCECWTEYVNIGFVSPVREQMPSLKAF